MADVVDQVNIRLTAWEAQQLDLWIERHPDPNGRRVKRSDALHAAIVDLATLEAKREKQRQRKATQ